MKRKIIITLLSFAAGCVLALIGFVPLRIDFQIYSDLGLIGLILLFAALILGLIILYPEKKRRDNLMSSRLTPLYKFYFPLIFITCLLYDTSLIFLNIFPGDDISIFIVLDVMLCIVSFLFIPHIRLRMVYLEKNQIVVSNFLSEFTLPISCIKSVKRYHIFLYKIIIRKGTGSQKIIFLPRLTESSNLFVTPKSVKVLKSLINH